MESLYHRQIINIVKWMVSLLDHSNQCLLGKICLFMSFSSVVVQIGETAAFKRANLAEPRLQFLMDASDMELQSFRVVEPGFTLSTMFCLLLGCVNLSNVTNQIVGVSELPRAFLADQTVLI